MIHTLEGGPFVLGSTKTHIQRPAVPATIVLRNGQQPVRISPPAVAATATPAVTPVSAAAEPTLEPAANRPAGATPATNATTATAPATEATVLPPGVSMGNNDPLKTPFFGEDRRREDKGYQPNRRRAKFGDPPRTAPGLRAAGAGK